MAKAAKVASAKALLQQGQGQDLRAAGPTRAHVGGDLALGSEGIVVRPTYAPDPPRFSEDAVTVPPSFEQAASATAVEPLPGLGDGSLPPLLLQGGTLPPSPPDFADEQQALLELADEQEKLAKRSADLQAREEELERFVGLESGAWTFSWLSGDSNTTRQMHSWWEPFMSGAGPLPGLASALVVPIRSCVVHFVGFLDFLGTAIDHMVEPVADQFATGLHTAICAVGICPGGRSATPQSPSGGRSALGSLAWALVGVAAAWLMSGNAPVRAVFSGLVLGLLGAASASVVVMAGVPVDFVRSSGAYMLLTVMTACVYKVLYMVGAPVCDLQNDSYWAFDLIDHRTFTSDFRVCVSAFLCPAARWAHTLTSGKIAPSVPFWPVVFVFAMLGNTSTAGVMEATKINASVVISALLSLVYWALLVSGRQRIRSVYEIPAGGWTVAEDALTWLLCFPCAMIQEAHQVERVDPDPSPPEDQRLSSADEAIQPKPCIGGWFCRSVQTKSPKKSPSPTPPQDPDLVAEEP